MEYQAQLVEKDTTTESTAQHNWWENQRIQEVIEWHK